MNVVRFAAALCLLTALTACGSASDAVTFTAPPGYVQKAAIGPFVQVWTAAASDSAIVLTALPTKMDLKEAVTGAGVKDAQIVDQKMISICNHQDALYADMLGGHLTTGSGEPATPKRIELLATVAGGKSYVVVYARPVKAPADPAAEGAIKNICPK